MSLEVNKRITECRKKAKMTKKEVAERLGIKYTTYCRMEEKAKRLTIEEIRQIAEVLGADVNYIIYGTKTEDLFAPLEPNSVIVETPTKGGVMPFSYDNEEKQPVTRYKCGEFECSAEERAIILQYRNSSLQDRQKICRLLESLQ